MKTNWIKTERIHMLAVDDGGNIHVMEATENTPDAVWVTVGQVPCPPELAEELAEFIAADVVALREKMLAFVADKRVKSPCVECSDVGYVVDGDDTFDCTCVEGRMMNLRRQDQAAERAGLM